MHAGRGRTARALSAGLVTGLSAGLVAGAALLGAPGVARAAETQPRPQACRDNSPELQSKKLTAAQRAAPTWPQQRLQFADAWQFGRGRGVVVAVVDSGVDASQPQLRGHVLEGFDVTGGSVEPGADTDCFAHGTAVAGIIAGQPLEGTAFTGIAPDVRILPVRQTWGVDDEGKDVQGDANLLIAAMQVAVRHAQVVNVSVTVPADRLRPGQKQAFETIAADAAARQVLIVTAAGNKNENDDKNVVVYPAALAASHDNVLAVGALNRDGTINEQSISGDFVTVAAPGAEMPCLFLKQGLLPCGGTSFAAPFVSGLAAMLRGRFPDLTAAQLKDRIVRTADHPSTDLPDPAAGYGVINPQAALTFALPRPAPAAPEPARAPVPVAGGVSEGTRVLALSVAGAALLVAVLAVVAGVAGPAGRRRRWQAGLRPPVRRSDAPNA